jgi:hypothetical protein
VELQGESSNVIPSNAPRRRDPSKWDEELRVSLNYGPLPAHCRKAATKTTTEDLPATSFTALLGHLATLTRNHLRIAGHDESGFDLLAIPTPNQRRAFELLGAPIPRTLK